MSSQLIFLVALVAGCSANPFIKANKASVDIPNLWKLEVDVGNIRNTEELASKNVTVQETQLYLEVEPGKLNPISCEPFGNNGVIDRNVMRDFDIALLVPLYPQFNDFIGNIDEPERGLYYGVRIDHWVRVRNDIIFRYSPRHLNLNELPVWEMDFNKEWTYEFDGTIYRLIFSIRKATL